MALADGEAGVSLAGWVVRLWSVLRSTGGLAEKLSKEEAWDCVLCLTSIDSSRCGETGEASVDSVAPGGRVSCIGALSFLGPSFNFFEGE